MIPLTEDWEAIAAELKRLHDEKYPPAPLPELDMNYAGWLAPVDYDPA